MATHFIIPDTQVRPGVPIDHLTAAGNYVVRHKPDVIIHLGDHFDMHSLSSYDRGTKKAEGANYQEDIRAGQRAMRAFLEPIKEYNRQRKANKKKQYKPRMVYLLGNHENRIARHINAYPILDGILGFHTLGIEEMGWEVIDFLKPITIDGLTYAHYFYNPMSGHPYGGKAPTKLNNIGFSFVMGHQQGLDMAMKHLGNGKTLRGIVAGSFYQHFEDYKGPQANDHWQGCLMLHEVEDGDFCLLELSLNYLMSEWL
jgi:hypothetical protein